MPHLCHAVNCKTPVYPSKLMCRHHWFMLPFELKRAVQRTYRVGQCGDRKPSKEWLEAARAAINWIRAQEAPKQLPLI